LVDLPEKFGKKLATLMLMNVLKEKKQPVIFFTDEKIFDLDSISNSRLDRYLSPEKACDVPDHVRFKFQTINPQNVMVFGLVASDAKTMPPFFRPKGTKVNTDEYIKVFEDVVKPWILANYGQHQCCQLLTQTFRPDQPKNSAAGEKIRPLTKSSHKC
jgi:hypothetical protein